VSPDFAAGQGSFAIYVGAGRRSDPIPYRPFSETAGIVNAAVRRRASRSSRLRLQLGGFGSFSEVFFFHCSSINSLAARSRNSGAAQARTSKSS